MGKHVFGFLVAAIISLWAASAAAQTVINAQDLSTCGALSATCLTPNANACGVGVTCGSIGTTAAICVPAVNPTYGSTQFPRSQITVANSSASATVSVGYNSAITVNGAGTITLATGQTAFWPRGTAPVGALYCVASVATTPAQIVIGQ